MTNQTIHKEAGESQRLIVVLGMHRSGTSLIARSLLAMGLSLGDHVMKDGVEDILS